MTSENEEPAVLRKEPGGHVLQGAHEGAAGAVAAVVNVPALQATQTPLDVGVHVWLRYLPAVQDAQAEQGA